MYERFNDDENTISKSFIRRCHTCEGVKQVKPLKV